jgi:hypothetical protein
VSENDKPQLKTAILASFSTEDLQQELINRECTRRAAEDISIAAADDFVLTHVGALLHLLPKHDRNDCTDLNPNNASDEFGRNQPRCRRCRLLRIDLDAYNVDTALDIVLTSHTQRGVSPAKLRVLITEKD